MHHLSAWNGHFRLEIAIALCLVVATFVVASAALAAFRGRLFDLYTGRLDGWVESGGNPQAIQATVVESCCRLVLTQAGWLERIELATIYRDELDFRVRMICGDERPYHELFVRLCEHDGLRP